MEALGWRRGWGSSPAARRGARQRASLTHAPASNTFPGQRETSRQKIRLTEITVSTATSSTGATSAIDVVLLGHS
jgi:hypothetical protein